MDAIIEKLKDLTDGPTNGRTWTAEEQIKLLELYLIISKKEHYIFELICRYHQCDSWEDIFRDYSPHYLADKAQGVQIAIDNMNAAEANTNSN